MPYWNTVQQIYISAARKFSCETFTPVVLDPFAQVWHGKTMTIAHVLFKYNTRVYHPRPISPTARTHSVHGHCSAVAHVRRTLMPRPPFSLFAAAADPIDVGGDRPRAGASAWAYEPTGWARAGRNAPPCAGVAAARESTRPVRALRVPRARSPGTRREGTCPSRPWGSVCGTCARTRSAVPAVESVYAYTSVSRGGGISGVK